MSTVSESLSQLEVLVVDCQATAAAPHGHLLEMGWARAGTTTTRADARLIALPDGEHIPAAVMRLTGISERMSQDGVDAHVAWRELSNEAATLARQPAPTVIHFARFEQPFLRALAGGALPLDILCTHDIARRLLPDLPRCGVRALTGYFGRGVGALRRSADHVEATAFVWRELVRLLRDEGISTWSVLQEWLADNRATRQRRRRVWPMPRNVRLSLPDAPGVYRMLRTSGDVLYVGKAASLRHRVNSYFRKQTWRARADARDAVAGAWDLCSMSRQAPSRRLSSSLTKSSSIDRRTTSRSPSRTARYGSRHRISPRAARTRRHSVRSDRFLRPECSMNLVRSPPLRVARSAPVAGVPTRSRSKQVTRGSARCTLSFRAKTSARTTDCCGSEHAYGEKVGETAMLMKTTPTKPGVD